MHKRAIIFLIVLTVIIFSVAIFFLWIHPNLDSYVDLQLHGAVIDENGQIISNVDFTIKGDIIPSGNGNFDLRLRIVFPDDFQYRMDEPDGPFSGYYSFGGKYIGVSYYPATCFIYDCDANKSIVANFALCTYHEYFILDWDDGKDIYLVASAAPDIPPETIVHYFQVFLTEMAFDN